jgi:hypothetical protein
MDLYEEINKLQKYGAGIGQENQFPVLEKEKRTTFYSSVSLLENAI